MRFVSLDFETTGVVNGLPNEPWQLGVVTFDLPDSPKGLTPSDCVKGLTPSAVHEGSDPMGGGWAVREWFFNIPSDRPFSPRALGRWAELREILADAPPFMEIWPELCDALTGVPLVAHNASTERTILEKRAPLTRFGPWIDTLRLVRKYWPLMKSYALGDLIATFGLGGHIDALCPGRSWHDALYDACAGAVLLTHIAKMGVNVHSEIFSHTKSSVFMV